MLTWTPDPFVTPWADVQEDEVWVRAAITASDPDALLTVASYSLTIIGDELFGLVTVCSPGGILVSAPASLIGSFLPVSLEYQINRVNGVCSGFPELPLAADEVIRYLPNPVNIKELTLRASAHLSDSSVETADFMLRVRANYSTGRDALIGAINARRH